MILSLEQGPGGTPAPVASLRLDSLGFGLVGALGYGLVGALGYALVGALGYGVPTSLGYR